MAAWVLEGGEGWPSEIWIPTSQKCRQSSHCREKLEGSSHLQHCAKNTIVPWEATTSPCWGTEAVWRASGVWEERQQEDRSCGSLVSLSGVLGKIFFPHITQNETSSLHSFFWKFVTVWSTPSALNVSPNKETLNPVVVSSLGKKMKSLIIQSDFCYPFEVTQAFFPSISSIHFYILHKTTPISTASDQVGVLGSLWLLFNLIF